MIILDSPRWSRLVLLYLFLLQPAHSGPKNRVKQFVSPDKSLVANVLTAEWGNGANTESKVEFRTGRGKLLGGKSFMSRDHRHGLGIIKAEWSTDSKYFVFSTISSGGQEPGLFPTFFYDRLDNKLHMLDQLMHASVTNPEFTLLFPDSVSVTVRDRLSTGEIVDTLSKTFCLSRLHQK